MDEEKIFDLKDNELQARWGGGAPPPPVQNGPPIGQPFFGPDPAPPGLVSKHDYYIRQGNHFTGTSRPPWFHPNRLIIHVYSWRMTYAGYASADRSKLHPALIDHPALLQDVDMCWASAEGAGLWAIQSGSGWRVYEGMGTSAQFYPRGNAGGGVDVFFQPFEKKFHRVGWYLRPRGYPPLQMAVLDAPM
jgi:hypothetical protein